MSRGGAHRREFILGGGLILAALFCAYGNIILRGQTLVASSNYHPFDYRFNHLDTGGAKAPAFLNWHDLGATWWQWEPAGKFFSRAFRAGRLPLWDSSVACGTDAHVNLTQGQYFPPYALMLWLGDSPILRDAYSLFLVFFGGICCFALFRRNGLSVLAGATAGILYALSGSMTQNVNSILGQCMAMIPGVVLVFDWFLSRPTWRRTAAAAAVLGGFVLTSFFPIVLSGLALLPILLVVRLVVGNARGQADAAFATPIAQASRLIAACVLGVGLAAFLLIPVSAAGRDPNFRAWYEGIGLQHFSPDKLLTLLSPIVSYEMWQSPDISKTMFRNDGPSPGFFYLGLIAFLLSLLAGTGRGRERRRLFWFFALSVVVVLTKMLGIPPVQWLGYLPVFKYIHFIPYWTAALTLGVAGLAGLGVERVVEGKPSAGRLWLTAGAIALFGAALAWFAGTHARNPQGDWRLHVLETLRLLLLAAAFLVILFLRRSSLSGRAAGAALLVLALLELAPIAFRTRFRRHDVWEDVPPYVAFLQQDRTLFRVAGAHGLALPPNTFQGLGLNGISSRDTFVSIRYRTLIGHYFPTESETRFLLPSDLLSSGSRRMLDLLNVKYMILLSPSPEQRSELAASGFVQREQDQSFEVFENTACWPRVYLASRFRVAPSPSAALEEIDRLSGPVEVVLEHQPLVARSGAAEGETGGCATILYSPDDVRFDCRSPVPRVLVLTDTGAAGWKVRVNGRPERLLSANYAFRAVEIPAGRSRVEFSYFTPGLASGLGVSGVCLTVIVGLAVAGRPSMPEVPQ
jgi:Bacterial membrane protein YfhO